MHKIQENGPGPFNLHTRADPDPLMCINSNKTDPDPFIYVVRADPDPLKVLQGKLVLFARAAREIFDYFRVLQGKLLFCFARAARNF